MKLRIILLFLIVKIYEINGNPGFDRSTNIKIFKNLYGIQDGNIRNGDAGDPLILTDLIEQGKIEEAKKAAKVEFEEFLGVESYAGFLTVDKNYGSNLFFWFFPSEYQPETDPIILWLQGGPGASSMYGLFGENGPLLFNENGELHRRPQRWNRENSVIYFDQPAGTGFSFTKGGQAQNQTKVGEDMYEALRQFFKLFPEYQSNDFFLTGESYAGKYIPAIGHTIWKNNLTADLNINLKGLAIGNGWSVPEIQLRYADFMYDHGFVDKNTRTVMDDLENQAVKLIQNGQYKEATTIIDKDFLGFSSVFQTATGFDNFYNYLYEYDEDHTDKFINELFRREDVRKALHVGNVPYQEDGVYNNLEEDISKSVAPLLEDLINNYRVLLYSGQLDLTVPYPLTIEYVKTLNFNTRDIYNDADRIIWFPNNNLDNIAGYVKIAGNFMEALVRNSGHMVPKDQPKWALELINKFIRNEPFESV